MKTAQRNYTGRIIHTSDEGRLLDQNYNNWQKIFAIGYDRISTLCGSYFPLGENMLEKLPKEIKDVLYEYPEGDQLKIFRTAVTFVNWFPAEAETDFNQDYRVSWAEAIELFQHYWKEARLGQFSSELLDSMKTLSLKDNVSLINRRKKFLDSGLIPTLVQKFFFSKNMLAFTGAFAPPDQSQKWRTVISRCFGTSEKADPEWDRAILISLLDQLKDMDPKAIVPFDQLRDTLEKQGLWTPDAWDFRGRAPSYFKFIKNPVPTTIKVESYQKILSSREQEINDKVQFVNTKLPPIFYEFIIQSIADLGLFEFEKNSTLFQSAYAQPWGQISSHRSNAVNRIMDQFVLHNSNKKIMEMVQPEIALVDQFCENMAIELGVQKYSIRKHQDNGIDEFFKYINSNTLEDALALVADDLYVNSLRNSNRQFLSFCYNHRNQLEVEKVKLALRWHFQQEKIDRGYLGYVSNVMDCPLRPLYGESKPNGTLKAGKWRSRLPVLKIRLVTDNGLVDMEFDVASFRSQQEFLFDEPNNPFMKVPRNTKHHNPSFSNRSAPDVALIRDKIQKYPLSVFKKTPAWGRGEDVWYVGIMPKFTCPEVKRSEQIVRMMGVNQGWSHNNGYCVLHKDDLINPVANGFLEWTHNPTIFAEPNWEANKNLLALYERLDPDCEDIVDFVQVVKLCCQFLKRKIRKDFDPIGDIFNIEQLVELVSPHFVNRASKNHHKTNGVGSLSVSRMEMFEALMQLVSTAFGFLEKSETTPNSIIRMANFLKIKERIEQKLYNIRMERSRIVARCILKTAIREKCDRIVLEEISNMKDLRSARRMNRGNARWCANRTATIVEHEAPLHGITVSKASSLYSSHKDVNGEPVCRKIKINPQTLPEKTPQGKRYQSFNSLNRKLDSYLRRDASDIYHQETVKFLGGKTFEQILNNAIKDGLEVMFVPCAIGDYVESVVGLIHSDVLAAQVICQRGFERLNKKKVSNNEEISLGASMNSLT